LCLAKGYIINVVALEKTNVAVVMVMEGRSIALRRFFQTSLPVSIACICYSPTTAQTIRPTDSVVCRCWYYYVVRPMTYSGSNKKHFYFSLKFFCFSCLATAMPSARVAALETSSQRDLGKKQQIQR
jgi:hypothetical protein